jgi:hypothetical protein
MLEGDHSFTIVFRPNDKGHELAAVINLYNEKISRDVNDLRVTVAALGEKLALIDVSQPGSTQNGVAEAAQLVSQLQEKLQLYKIRP